MLKSSLINCLYTPSGNIHLNRAPTGNETGESCSKVCHVHSHALCGFIERQTQRPAQLTFFSQFIFYVLQQKQETFDARLTVISRNFAHS